jgi:hypothetical protein
VRIFRGFPNRSTQLFFNEFFVTIFADFWPKMADNENIAENAVLESDHKLQSWLSFLLRVFGSEQVHPAGRQFTEMPDKEFCYFSPFFSSTRRF